MSDFSDNANKYLADGYLRFWPSVGTSGSSNLAPEYKKWRRSEKRMGKTPVWGPQARELVALFFLLQKEALSQSFNYRLRKVKS